jgi:SAM-dependent methyltransferase
MTADVVDYLAWQDEWDRQQTAYMPDREERFTALLDVVDAVAPEAHDRPVRLLDLAGGTGSITLRALARRPDAEVVLLDVDPSLLALAEGTLAARGLADRVTIVRADLADPAWTGRLPHRAFDAVLTATALHWMAADRLAALYAEIRGLLVDGGVFANADHMPDPDLPGLTARLVAYREDQRQRHYAAGAALDWTEWWNRLRGERALAGAIAERDARFGGRDHADEHNPPVDWHTGALRRAGYAEVGVVWRGLTDAAVAAVR